MAHTPSATHLADNPNPHNSRTTVDRYEDGVHQLSALHTGVSGK